AFGPENHGMAEEIVRERVRRVAAQLKLTPLLDRSIFSLSGGEKQKIACGSAAATEPDIYVFDEPSSNLDTYAIADFRQLLSILKAQGKTVIISEHRLYYLTGLFDRVLYLKDGEIAGDYTADEFCGLSEKQREEMGLRPLALAGLSGVEGVTHREHKSFWTLKDMSFAYQHGPEILHITETAFPSGGATAIIGHNGAGKSTFARCLCGLEKRCRGMVRERDKIYSGKERLKLCYMVMQDVNHQLFTESVLDEILLSMKTEDEQKAREILREMDLLSFEDCHPLGLSGGQKQRVAVASAIASERPLILFDEPTSGLDLFHMRQVADVVGKVANAGRTALVVTHDPEFILRCCNYVLHLENGQIQESYSIENSDGRKRLLAFFQNDTKI
ncbi:MAG: energy-coupling factor ABC transporter ATP-binding protein, partial [Eubacteriales bacterium]|nr:energy-coupling factor ABC transporter ATP-binding protein [Eubacteriales bacterium]